MADNVVLNSGTGGSTAAADDIGGIHYQRVKLTLGADAVNDGDVSQANPIPCGQSGTWTVAQGGSPWGVSVIGAGLVGASQVGTWTVAQGTNPWATSSTTTTPVSQTGSPWGVSSIGAGLVGASQVGVWGVSLTGAGLVGASQVGTWGVSLTGAGLVGASQVGTWGVSTIGTNLVAGNVAHDAVDSGSPVKVGGRAQSTQVTGVTDGDRVNQSYDLHGNARVRSGHQGPAASFGCTNSVPAANTLAFCARANAAAGIRNVCTALTVVLAATASAPTAVNVTAKLVDGTSAGTANLWQATISLPATAGAMNGIALSDVWFPGTAGTTMTLMFSAAGGANTVESVAMCTTQITE